MAFDTADKLRNGLGFGDDLATVALLPDGIVDQDDLENWLNIYFPFEHDPFPVAPTAAFGYTLDPYFLRAFFLDQSLGSPTSWSWDFGDVASGSENFSTEQNPVHEFTAFGTYRVRLVATNAQGSDSVEHLVEVIDPGLPYVPIHYHTEQGRGRLVEQFRTRGPLT